MKQEAPEITAPIGAMATLTFVQLENGDFAMSNSFKGEDGKLAPQDIMSMALMGFMFIMSRHMAIEISRAQMAMMQEQRTSPLVIPGRKAMN